MLRTISRTTIVLAAAILATGALAQDGGGRELRAPTGLEALQTGYADGAAGQGDVVLRWTNGEEYLALEVLVDDELRAILDGTTRAMTLSDLAAGERTIGLRGIVADAVSELSTLVFEVRDASPLVEPIADVECVIVDERGGTLSLSWSSGADAWESGHVLVAGRVVAAIAPDDGSLEVEAVGRDDVSVGLVFRSAEGYASEILEPSCDLVLETFRRGDCDNDGFVTISDPIFELTHLFLGGRRWYCDDACDADDDGNIVVTDPIIVLQWLFSGGAMPAAPGPMSCGLDVEVDFLGGVCGCPGA